MVVVGVVVAALIVGCLLWSGAQARRDRRADAAGRRASEYYDRFQRQRLAQVTTVRVSVRDRGPAFGADRFQWTTWDHDADHLRGDVEGATVPFAIGSESTREDAQRAAVESVRQQFGNVRLVLS
jgi:hypothetical protein